MQAQQGPGAKAAQGIPAGFRLASLPGLGGLLSLAVVVRETSHAEDGNLVVLRTLPTGRVFLAAMIDAQQRVHEWVEFWVQDLSALRNSLHATREELNNVEVDARWIRDVELLQKLDPSSVII